MKRRWGPGEVVSACVANPGIHGVGRLPTGDIRVCVYYRIFLIEAFPRHRSTASSHEIALARARRMHPRPAGGALAARRDRRRAAARRSSRARSGRSTAARLTVADRPPRSRCLRRAPSTRSPSRRPTCSAWAAGNRAARGRAAAAAAAAASPRAACCIAFVAIAFGSGFKRTDAHAVGARASVLWLFVCV